MRIAIYNVWDGEELLEYSINSIRQHVDKIICVVQEVSNWGQFYSGGIEEAERLTQVGLVDEICHFPPNKSLPAGKNETNKRNLGISVARKMGASYYMLLDCDELWLQFPSKPDCAHRLYTYFKEPTLRYDPIESYYVPGLITMRSNSNVGLNNCGFYVDPTRSPNVKLTLGKEYMHHFSYVRNDLARKIENSSAKSNIFTKKKELEEDLSKAAPGYNMKYTDKKLISVPNIFNIDTRVDKSI